MSKNLTTTPLTTSEAEEVGVCQCRNNKAGQPIRLDSLVFHRIETYTHSSLSDAQPQRTRAGFLSEHSCAPPPRGGSQLLQQLVWKRSWLPLSLAVLSRSCPWKCNLPLQGTGAPESSFHCLQKFQPVSPVAIWWATLCVNPFHPNTEVSLAAVCIPRVWLKASSGLQITGLASRLEHGCKGDTLRNITISLCRNLGTDRSHRQTGVLSRARSWQKVIQLK